MSTRAGRARRTKRALLGRVVLDDRLIAEIERSGLLDVRFTSSRSDAAIASDDGNRTVAWLAPSGAITAILVQDYCNGESRRVPFSFGTIDIEHGDGGLSFFIAQRASKQRRAKRA